MEWYVTVTRTFVELVDAPTAEEAEEMVRNMVWADIPCDIEVDVDPTGEQKQGPQGPYFFILPPKYKVHCTKYKAL